MPGVGLGYVGGPQNYGFYMEQIRREIKRETFRDTSPGKHEPAKMKGSYASVYPMMYEKLSSEEKSRPKTAAEQLPDLVSQHKLSYTKAQSMANSTKHTAGRDAVGAFGMTSHGSGYSNIFSELQERDASPGGTPAVHYMSNNQYRAAARKHVRRPLDPEEEYIKPLTESHKVGWASARRAKSPGPQLHHFTPREFKHRSTELSQYNDSVTRVFNGRSVGHEFSAYGVERLTTQSFAERARTQTLTLPRYAQ